MVKEQTESCNTSCGNSKKVTAIVAVIGVALGALSGIAGHAYFAEPVVTVETKEVIKEVPVDHIVEVIKNVEVPVEHIVTKEVPVDNGNLDLVLQHIYDNDGDVAYLTSDLKDTEVAQIADRIVFVNDIKALAVAEVKKNGIKELDKEMVGTVKLDDSDIESFKIKSNDDEISVDDIDFDDSDADLSVTARFYQDDVKYEAVFTVEVKDSKIDDLSVDSISVI
jgi:hypothetical protein